jgi:hypothetical protein
MDCLGHVYVENKPNALTSKPQVKKKRYEKQTQKLSAGVGGLPRVEYQRIVCEAVGTKSGDPLGEYDRDSLVPRLPNRATGLVDHLLVQKPRQERKAELKCASLILSHLNL